MPDHQESFSKISTAKSNGMYCGRETIRGLGLISFGKSSSTRGSCVNSSVIKLSYWMKNLGLGALATCPIIVLGNHAPSKLSSWEH